MSYYKDVIKDIAGNMQELHKNIPDVMGAFMTIMQSSTADGVLDKRPKN